MSRNVRVAIVLAALMGLASVGGMAARPASKPPGSAPRYILEDTVPKQFGDWRMLPDSGAQVVNPQTQERIPRRSARPRVAARRGDHRGRRRVLPC